MNITYLIALIGFVITVVLGFNVYTRTKNGQPRPLILWSALSFAALVMLFPSVWANIIIGILKGMFILPQTIGKPDLGWQFFSIDSMLILTASAVLAGITFWKLNKVAKSRGMTLSEFIMQNQPTDEQKSLGKPADLDESIRETYHEPEGTEYVQHDR